MQLECLATRPETIARSANNFLPTNLVRAVRSISSSGTAALVPECHHYQVAIRMFRRDPTLRHHAGTGSSLPPACWLVLPEWETL